MMGAGEGWPKQDPNSYMQKMRIEEARTKNSKLRLRQRLIQYSQKNPRKIKKDN